MASGGNTFPPFFPISASKNETPGTFASSVSNLTRETSGSKFF